MTLKAITALLAATALAGPATAQTDNADRYCQAGLYPADTNDDGQLSDDELQIATDGEFAALDFNKDGSIDRPEYVNCTTTALQAAVDAMPRGESDEVFIDIDTNADGTVTVEEFRQAAMMGFERIASGDVGATGWDHPFISLPQGMDSAAMDRETFTGIAARINASLDTDADDTLSRAEWIDRGSDLVLDASAINQRFDGLDTDGSDSIDRDELATGNTAAADAARQDAGLTAKDAPPLWLFYFRRG